MLTQLMRGGAFFSLATFPADTATYPKGRQFFKLGCPGLCRTAFQYRSIYQRTLTLRLVLRVHLARAMRA